MAVEIIPLPPTARLSSKSAAESKPDSNLLIETQANKETDENLSSADTAQNQELKLISDEKLDDEKNASETDVLFSAPLTSPPQNDFNQLTSADESRNNENFDDYLSEIKSKHNNARTTPQTSRQNYLFIVGTTSVVLVFFGGLAVLGWYFASRETVPKQIPENEMTAEAKSKANQKLLSPPEMVYVAGGEFMMGSNDGDEFSRPAHRVSVKSFFIDKTEVTCTEYKKFVDATGHQPPLSWRNRNFPPGAGRKPVTGVNWEDANAFASWINKRLPTEEEWEYAARGTDARIYPWGNDWKPEMANADKQKNGVQDVGAAGGQSPFGVFDMSGNAWEWTADNAKPYPGGKSFVTNSTDAKIIRGGFFGSAKEKATTTFRRAWGAHSETDYGNTSFRCAHNVPAEQ